MRKDQAQIEIFFAGDLAPFLETVKREGLFLSPASGDLWQLRDLKDVPAEEIKAFRLPNASRSLETENLPDLTPAQGDAETDVVDVLPSRYPTEQPTIPVMRMDEYQVIPSVTQPESAELLTSPASYNGETP